MSGLPPDPRLLAERPIVPSRRRFAGARRQVGCQRTVAQKVRKVSITLATAVALASAAGASIDARPFTLHLSRLPTPEIAGLQLTSFRQATAALGRPEVSLDVKSVCRARWPTLGLQIDFSTLQSGSCAPAKIGRWIRVRAWDRRWHTLLGLRVGDPLPRLHRLYPDGRSLDFLGQGRLWELETGGLLCDGGSPLALAAQVSADAVTALLIVHVPACG